MERFPVVAGQFYPISPDQLRKDVGSYLAGAPPQRSTRTLLTMVPHAGYIYSGGVAGKTIGTANLPETIILLGPNHTGRGAPVSVWPSGIWHTPLGAVPVASDIVSELVTTDPLFSPDTGAHLGEHSLEAILPFLQVKHDSVRIVPIALMDHSPESLARTGAAIAKIMQKHTTTSIVVSSDMSHFLSHENTIKVDKLALAMIESLDPEGLYNTVREHQISMCGVLPMTVGMIACRLLGAVSAEIVAYATSGETSGDMEQVVGYAGAIVQA